MGDSLLVLVGIPARIGAVYTGTCASPGRVLVMSPAVRMMDRHAVRGVHSRTIVTLDLVVCSTVQYCTRTHTIYICVFVMDVLRNPEFPEQS